MAERTGRAAETHTDIILRAVKARLVEASQLVWEAGISKEDKETAYALIGGANVLLSDLLQLNREDA